MTPSKFQAAIYEFGKSIGNAIVQAVAGSGKTTTLCELVKLLIGSVIFLAFNRAIAEELKARGVNARTFHSICTALTLRSTGARDITKTGKLPGLMREHYGERDQSLYGTFACKMVGLARQVGIGCLVADTEQAWIDIAEHHGVELDNDHANYSDAFRIARELLAHSTAAAFKGVVDFDDVLYLPVLKGWKLPTFDNILVDEAQDTNAIQRAIIRKMMRPNSRLFAVGDSAQAIYGFRGADSDSMSLIANEFDCKPLPLSISYRCARAIVREAKKYVPHIEASETAPEGSVTTSTDWTPKSFRADDLIVCRNTKPLIALAYQCIRDGVPARVLGREIGEGLVKLIEQMRAKGIEALSAKLEEYRVRETQKAIAKGNEAAAEAITDRVACVVFMIGTLDENSRTIPALIASITRLFDQSAGRVTLATIHKSKGLEASRVWWLNPSLCPSKWARQEWQKQQERNLMYVAVTRAKLELIKIESEE